MKVRFEHRRRTMFFARLRGMAMGFLAFGAVALACGIYVARSSPLLLAGSMVGMGFGIVFLWFLRRTQRQYEQAYLELEQDNLTVAGENGAKTLKWTQVKSAKVVRLGSRLRIEGSDGSIMVFPFAESMRRITESQEEAATPQELVAELGERVEVIVDWGAEAAEGVGAWKVVDVVLFCLAGFLLLLHVLAGLLMVAPGSRLAQAGLVCIALLGALLSLRGLGLGRAVTAVGVFRGSAARAMGWFGAGGAVLALLLALII